MIFALHYPFYKSKYIQIHVYTNNRAARYHIYMYILYIQLPTYVELSIPTELLYTITVFDSYVFYFNPRKLFSALQSSETVSEDFISKEELEHVCRMEDLPLSEQLVHASIMKYIQIMQTRYIKLYYNTYLYTWI